MRGVKQKNGGSRGTRVEARVVVTGRNGRESAAGESSVGDSDDEVTCRGRKLGGHVEQDENWLEPKASALGPDKNNI